MLTDSLGAGGAGESDGLTTRKQDVGGEGITQKHGRELGRRTCAVRDGVPAPAAACRARSVSRTR